MSTDNEAKTVNAWTPGEWRSEKDGDDYLIMSQDTNKIAYFVQSKADAQVIAASKELYEALIGLSRIISLLQYAGAIPYSTDTLADATAALLKANPAAFEAPGHE